MQRQFATDGGNRPIQLGQGIAAAISGVAASASTLAAEDLLQGIDEARGTIGDEPISIEPPAL